MGGIIGGAIGIIAIILALFFLRKSKRAVSASKKSKEYPSWSSGAQSTQNTQWIAEIQSSTASSSTYRHAELKPDSLQEMSGHGYGNGGIMKGSKSVHELSGYQIPEAASRPKDRTWF